MKYITDAKEAAAIDSISIQEIGIPSLVLMEKASMAVAGYIKSFLGSHKKTKILSVCGMGNNGGDGVAAARLLKEEGYNVEVFLIGNKEKATAEMATQIEIAQNLDVPFITNPLESEYTVIIDAIFGIGLSRNVAGEYKDWIEWINEKNSHIVAVDIPSGIDASYGRIFGCAVKADCTVTFGNNKRGIVLFPGAVYAGNVIVADIGFPDKAVESVLPKAYTYTKEDMISLMPKRKMRTNKGSYGKVLVIAGSKEMCGACFFAAKAAYRMGCGLVKIVTAPENTQVLKTKLPEAIINTECSEEDINWADVIAIGPGIGQSEQAEKLVKTVISVKNKPVVMDADALNILAKLLKNHTVDLSDNFIITPHLKEMSRIINEPVEKIKENIMQYASVQTRGCIIVLKDARTIVSNGTEYYINMTGNNALSTGGSGDVLCGMTAGLLAQGMTPFEAAKLAVCIHGLAAESYTENRSRYAMLASDIIEELTNILPF